MKAWRALLLASTAIISPTLAQADPVSAVAIATTVGTAVAATTISSTIVAALVSTAIGLAGALATRLLTPTVKQQAELRTGEQDPHPAWRRAYGEFKHNGALVFKYVESENLYCVWLISDSKGGTLQKLWLNDIEMELLDDAENDLTDFTKGAKTNTGPFWDDDVAEFWYADGTQTSWPAEFTFLENLPGVFRTTDLYAGNGQGSAVLFGRFTFGNSDKAAKRWPTGAPPRVEVLVQHSRLYDPRRDSTSGVQTVAQGDHRPDDDTTWQYIADDGTEIGANPALCALDAMRWERGLGIADERILIQQIADAADCCEIQDSAGGRSHTLRFDFDSSSEITERTVSGGELIDPGSGVLFYDKGTMSVSGGDLNITAVGGEARIGIYFDLTTLGLDTTVSHTFDVAGSATGASRTESYASASGGGDASEADKGDFSMPSDAANITDEGDGPAATTDISGRYFSWTYEWSGNGTQDFLEFTITENTAARVRYRCDGLLKVETNEYNLLDPILASMAGHLDPTGGKIGIRAGCWVAPTDTLSQPIADDWEYIGQSDPGFAKVIPSFISRARHWEETDGQPYVLRSGDKVFSLGLDFVREPEQAARLAKISGEQAKLARALNGYVVPAREGARRIGERVTVAIPQFGRADGIYRIMGKQPVFEALEGGAFRHRYILSLQEDAEATYDWSAPDYTEDDAANPDPQIPSENVAPAISAEQFDYRDTLGNDVPWLQIDVTPTSLQVSNGGDIQIQTKEAGGAWETLGYYTTETAVQAFRKDVSVGVTYTARARHSSGSLGVSDWAVSDPVTIIAADVSALELETNADNLLLESGGRLRLE